MYVSNATGCSSIWGGPAATSPYCTNKEGKGPAWCNSLFEDNAEHGFGMFVGQEKIRQDLAELAKKLVEDGVVAAEAQAWLDSYSDGEANKKATADFVAALEKCSAPEAAAILEKKEYLAKKSVWIFGGDGWAYDIGYGGLDHVIAQKQDVNIFVFDTEVYSNTGGQASKASNIGQVAQFAAAGKEVKKKSLSEIAMQYGYVYVAQVAMGANPAQTIKAITEAEAYHGPSLIIGYAPCEMHSIKGGMMNCQKEMKKAVDCGYWNLFRYNPEGEKKFSLDSKAPAGGYQEFLMNEARYSRLTREFPERAGVLFEKNEEEAKARWEHLQKLISLYND
jgi:pyruvate-ferredoxin/flavodoxin oxidoreductase